MSHGPRDHLDDAPPERVPGGLKDGTADGTTMDDGGDEAADGPRDDGGA
ncbi:hypothetical protein ACFQE8_04695 [Salinirubellus sp. GCM10025818]